jgi:hypothetical protein
MQNQQNAIAFGNGTTTPRAQNCGACSKFERVAQWEPLVSKANTSGSLQYLQQQTTAACSKLLAAKT